MTGHDDFDFEPIPGLPARLPEGEVLLWQGRPATLPLARQAFGLTAVLFYFAAIVIWRGSVGYTIAGTQGALAYGLPYAGLGLLGALVILGLAYAQSRGSIYSITSARVVMRVGAALPVTVNLPFSQIASADLALTGGGYGTIALTPKGDARLAYVALWPHVRPWAPGPTRPALRAIPDAEAVARLLAEAAENRLMQPVVSRTVASDATPPMSTAQAVIAAE